MESWDKTFSLFVAAIFSKSTEEMDRSVGLSKHINHYDPQSGFAYYNLTTLPLREHSLSTTYGHALWVGALGTFASTQPLYFEVMI